MGTCYEKLKQAAEQSQWLLFKKLLKNSECDQDDLNELLAWAAENNYTNIVIFLLEDGRANPAAVNSYALRGAAWCGHADIVKLLLEDGRSDPTSKNSKALYWAAENCHTDIVKLLLKDGRVDRNVLKGTEYEYLLQEARTGR